MRTVGGHWELELACPPATRQLRRAHEDLLNHRSPQRLKAAKDGRQHLLRRPAYPKIDLTGDEHVQACVNELVQQVVGQAVATQELVGAQEGRRDCGEQPAALLRREEGDGAGGGRGLRGFGVPAARRGLGEQREGQLPEALADGLHRRDAQLFNNQGHGRTVDASEVTVNGHSTEAKHRRRPLAPGVYFGALPIEVHGCSGGLPECRVELRGRGLEARPLLDR
mmetsp:Transcript_117080/g.338426  ORF Transcript_117080/g.338426 Transcript_117080/m.338426 type:complete len:224 (+) Transcript_117080:4072-4743(+)